MNMIRNICVRSYFYFKFQTLRRVNDVFLTLSENIDKTAMFVDVTQIKFSREVCTYNVS